MDAELEDGKPPGRSSTTWVSTIFYRVDGPPAGSVPICWRSGYPFNSWDWSLIRPAITQRFTVIAPDMIGMGFSDKPRARTSIRWPTTPICTRRC